MGYNHWNGDASPSKDTYCESSELDHCGLVHDGGELTNRLQTVDPSVELDTTSNPLFLAVHDGDEEDPLSLGFSLG